MTDLQSFGPALPEDEAPDQMVIPGEPAVGAAAKAEEPAQRSPWRSLGGAFDYEHWEDRDRFVELDFLILMARSDEDEPYRLRRNAHLAAA